MLYGKKDNWEIIPLEMKQARARSIAYAFAAKHEPTEVKLAKQNHG